MNTSLIKTAKGLNITLKHDTSNPRPYDRINQLAGTKGVFADYPPHLFRRAIRRGRVGQHRRLEGASASALEAGRRDCQEARRPRRHGLHHALPPHAMHERRPCSRHGCLRRSCLVRSRPIEQGLSSQWKRPAKIPRLHAGPMARTFSLANSHANIAHRLISLISGSWRIARVL